MRLIDADALVRQLTTEGCDYYGAEFYAYVAGLDHAKNEIEDADEIDPVHAAGGVYCRECKFAQKRGYGYLFCTNGNRKYAGWCKDNDFCSRGIKREEEDDG